MFPSPARPAFGRFVADQVDALARLDDVDVEVFAFPGGSPSRYLRAAAVARRRFHARRFDVVHAHFGLSAWPALAVPARVRAVTLHGSDLAHPRSAAITRAALPWLDLVGVVSAELGGQVPPWAARGGVQVLPCGVDLTRFGPLARAEARHALGLAPEVPCVLFPAAPARPEKRFDLAEAALAGARARLPAERAASVRLLSLGDVAPERVPLYVNAANVVVIPSDREGFGLACLEALACDVPVLSTPHGVAPAALQGLDGCHCGEFDAAEWAAAIAAHLGEEDPRVPGRERARAFSAEAMAERVLTSWRGLLVGAAR